jgi:hypothetical protein
MTKTEQIAAAVMAALSGAGLRVRSDTLALYAFEDFPVVVLVLGHEAPSSVIGGGLMVTWTLQLSLFIGAEGAAPTLAPEPTRAAAHAALYADRTLGGLVIDTVAGGVNRQIDADNPAAGITEAAYTITYRQLEDAL